MTSCAGCLRRAWLVTALAGSLTHAARGRRLAQVLALGDEELIAAVAGPRRAQVEQGHRRFDAETARGRCAAAGVETVCRHDRHYPEALADLPDAPAVLHVAGSTGRLVKLLGPPAVAVVGARRATPYGLEVARSLGRGLAAAGVTVVSGMALGVDSAAHAGALEGGGRTIAVLAGAAERPYPASKRMLWRRLVGTAAVVSEMPPGFVAHRWCFPARNRIIAGLAAATVVVEAGERSGALITAQLARDLGRDVAAVPGRVTCTLAAGTNALLYDGAQLVRDARDVLELLFGAGAAPASDAAGASASGAGDHELDPQLRRVLGAVRDGRDSVHALTADGVALDDALAGLAQLELLGHLRREPGGRYAPVL